MPNNEATIVGGGVAGAYAAIVLARRGIQTRLIEKEKSARHKVCGEFLSQEGALALKEIGVDLDGLGATQISSLRVFAEDGELQSSGVVSARGISRFVLDEVLLELAAKAGAEITRGEIVKALDQIESSIIVLATGKHDLLQISRRDGESKWVAYKMHLQLEPEALAQLNETIQLFIFRGGYGGLCEIENGKSNLCVLISKSQVKEVGTSWPLLQRYLLKMCPQMRDLLLGCQPLFERPVTIGQIPYGFRKQNTIDCDLIPGKVLFFVGDQAEVIPSLTGDGMSLAIRSAKRAADEIEIRLRRGALSESTQKKGFSVQMKTARLLQSLFERPSLTTTALSILRALPAGVRDGSMRALFNLTRA